MFDSIANVNDYLSEHWLAEVFPNKLKDFAKIWKELATQGKDTPIKGLVGIDGSYLTSLAGLPAPGSLGYVIAVTGLHRKVLSALGFDVDEAIVETYQGETPIKVPLLGRFASTTSTDALHILQAVPVDNADALFGDEAELLHPLELLITAEKTELVSAVAKAITQLFISDHAPRYLLVVAGGVALLTDAARWSEGRYLAFDIATALDRRDDKATGELAHHAGLWSADVLLPNDDGKTTLDTFTEDSEKHAVGVSEDLREGLRISIEKIANEVLEQRRVAGMPVEGIPELPRDLTIQSLRFLYRILFLLFAEARPELGILPVGAPEYGSGYGLDRLREIIQVPLTGRSARGHHLHESLSLLFRLVNDGHGAGTDDGDGLVFEAMRSDLFDPKRTPLIDDATISNKVLQEVLTLLLLSKPSKNKTKQRGYISYAQLGINQLGAVYEGLMSYTGLIAPDDMVEVAKDGNADKGSWLVASTNSGDYDAKDLVWREDRLTGRKDLVRHVKGSFVFRLSGRDRQRSASFYTPEILTKTVVKHALAELITDETTAAQILEYRICEPALGSGAFLNEAINQLAAEYLARRQNELGERINPEDYAAELQKVKAYLALHRAYGVDLNATAVELAEVSLWLNVMYQGLQAPWFGLHLRRGNSLIGARRATYDFTSLGRAKKSWLTTPPTDRPLSEGGIGEGEIHHFLVPSQGWGAVADAKQAKELAPESAAVLRKWRSEVTKKPTTKQLDRLRALSRRVERLWQLTLRRLEISEREVSRQVDIWGSNTGPVSAAVTREQVESELLDPEGPYMRLRLAMDAWCALWFWPLPESEKGANLRSGAPGLDGWINALEGLLGADGVRKGSASQGMFHEAIDSYAELSTMDDLERGYFGMKPLWRLVADYQWLGSVRSIAEMEGFFHWELDFAQIFHRGGFDLQVGNPPWVRPIWKDDETLAEIDPYLVLAEKMSESDFRDRRQRVLDSNPKFRREYLGEVASWTGMAQQLGSPVEHPVLSGLQTNLYTNFMEMSWRMLAPRGISGLIHQDSHLIDPKAGRLRRESYPRIRRSWNFLNKMKVFPDIGDGKTFSINVYGARAAVDFLYAATLLHPRTLEESFFASPAADLPGVQLVSGEWDQRPHPSRIIHVTEEVLQVWARLFDPVGTAPLESKLARPLLAENQRALEVFSNLSVRMSDIGYRWSTGWHEKSAKQLGIIKWDTRPIAELGDIILQGPHFGVSNPYGGNPRIPCKGSYDYETWDLRAMGDSDVPRSNYVRATTEDRYKSGFKKWGLAPYPDSWRLVVRDMIDAAMERTLICALIPPGPAHVNTVNSLAVLDKDRIGTDDYLTALTVGLWSSIPFDYLVKVSGKSHLQVETIDRFPLPVGHPTVDSIVLRTLRLNCLTRHYAGIWESLYRESFCDDTWALQGLPTANLGKVPSEWSRGVALRDERSRRAALVEIDVLAALALGLDVETLVSLYRAQFWKMSRRESETYFDARGSRIALDSFAFGARQQKGDYAALQAFHADEDCGDLLDRYLPFPPDSAHDRPWFYNPDRETEMRSAYAEFERRLDLNG